MPLELEDVERARCLSVFVPVAAPGRSSTRQSSTFTMPHNHDHGNCNDGSHHHDHQHDIPEHAGPRDNLFSRIDRDHVMALNVQAPGKGPEVIKPWDQRLDEAKVCSSLSSFCEASAA